METVQFWLEKTFFNNTVGQYGTALLTLVGLVLVFMLVKRLFVSNIVQWAARTPGNFSDLLASLVSKMGPLVLITTAFYFSTLPLELNTKLRSLIFGALVIVLTVQVVRM